MATFPAGPITGQTVTIGSNIFVWNGYGWTSDNPLYVSNLKDVDLSIPPTNGQVLTWDTTASKWKPLAGGGTGGATVIYQTATPPFVGLSVGAVWIKSDTLEQYIYIKDDLNRDVWITLGSVTSTTNSTPVAGRNRIRNGCGLVNQRYGFSSAFTVGAGWTWIVDGWRTESNIANKFTLNASAYVNATNIPSNPPGFLSHFGGRTTTVHTLASNDWLFLSQSIEGYNTADFLWGTVNARPITISFWMFASNAGSYSVALRNNATNRTYVKDVTHSGGSTWEYKWFTVLGDTNAASWNSNTVNRNLQICFNLGHGTAFRTATTDTWLSGNFLSSNTSFQTITVLNATVGFTGVQLELGSVNTPYEIKTFQQDMEECERYFQKSYFYDVSIGTNTGTGCVSFNPWSGWDRILVQFRRRMRWVPTISITPSNASGFGSLGRFWNGSGFVTGAISDAGDASFILACNGNGGVNAINAFHWWAEAEV